MYLKDLSIVTSAYNEEDNISQLLDEIIDLSKKSGLNVEIVAVDNGSIDKTGKICDMYQKKSPSLIKAVHAGIPTLGKGNGVRLGIENSSGKYIAVIDSDLQFNTSDVFRLLDFLKKNNLGYVIGWRKHRQDSFSRLFLSRVYNILIKILFNMPIEDVGASPKLFKREAIINAKIKSKKWIIEIELPHIAKLNGYSGASVEVIHKQRKAGESKVNFKGVIGLIFDFFKYCLRI